MSAGADATAAATVVTGDLFLDIELSRLAQTYLLHDLWRNYILPYLPFRERQSTTKWSQREQLASLADTFEYELETLVGAAFWKQTLKPGLIRYGAVITGSWPLRVMMGTALPPDGSDIDVLISASPDADLHWESPLAALFRTPADTFHLNPAGGSGLTYAMKGIVSIQRIGLTLPTRQTRSMHSATKRHRRLPAPTKRPPFELTSVKIPDEDREVDGTAKANALVRWIERGFDFDACMTTYDPRNTTQPVYVSPRTTIDRLCRGETTFRFVYDPNEAWARMLKYKRRGIVFDPIEPNGLLAQIRTVVANWPWEQEDDRRAAELAEEMKRDPDEKPRWAPPWNPYIHTIVLDVWMCGPAGTFRVFQPSPAFLSGQFQRSVASRTLPSTFTLMWPTMPPSPCAYTNCIYTVCHPGKQHIHLNGSVILLVHDRQASVESVGSKRAPALAATDGQPSPAKRQRPSASASAASSSSSNSV